MDGLPLLSLPPAAAARYLSPLLAEVEDGVSRSSSSSSSSSKCFFLEAFFLVVFFFFLSLELVLWAGYNKRKYHYLGVYSKTNRVNVGKLSLINCKIFNGSTVPDGPLLYVQGSAKRWALGCVNPDSWLPLAAGGEFTQPRANLLTEPCICITLVLGAGAT